MPDPVGVVLDGAVGGEQAAAGGVEDVYKRQLREYQKDVMKNVMMPAMARPAHDRVEKRMDALRQYAETSGINTVEYNDRRIGIIAAGTSYTCLLYTSRCV